MRLLKCSLAVAILGSLSALGAAREPALELINNQPFPIYMPVEVRQFRLGDGHWVTSDKEPAQSIGSNVVFIARVAGSTTKRVSFRPGPSKTKAALALRAKETGI